jgi:DNA repair protein RecO (recombination protein O)
MILPEKNWIKEYVFWELKLLKLVGYDLELKNMVNQEIINNEKKYFVKNSTEKKIVPNFLIDLDKDELNNINLLNGLKLVGDYLEKIILKPNNINYPTSRLDFINILK